MPILLYIRKEVRGTIKNNVLELDIAFKYKGYWVVYLRKCHKKGFVNSLVFSARYCLHHSRKHVIKTKQILRI